MSGYGSGYPPTPSSIYGSGGAYGGGSAPPIGGFSNARFTDRATQEAASRAPWRQDPGDHSKRHPEDDSSRRRGGYETSSSKGGRAPERSYGSNRGYDDSHGKGSRGSDHRVPDSGPRAFDRPTSTNPRDRNYDGGAGSRAPDHRMSDGKNGPRAYDRSHDDSAGSQKGSRGLDHRMSGGKGGPRSFDRSYDDGAGKGRDPMRGGEGITLSTCEHKAISEIVSGRYYLHGENHGKAVYKKVVPGSEDVYPLVYYWDDRDGVSFQGWWIGPKVGGDQVWGFHFDGSGTFPPGSGWRIPFDGSIDPIFTLTRNSSDMNTQHAGGDYRRDDFSTSRPPGDYGSGPRFDRRDEAPTPRPTSGYGSDPKSRESYGSSDYSAPRSDRRDEAPTPRPTSGYGSDPRSRESHGSSDYSAPRSDRRDEAPTPRPAGGYGSDPRGRDSYGSDGHSASRAAGGYGSDARSRDWHGSENYSAHRPSNEPRPSSGYGSRDSHGPDNVSASRTQYGSDPRSRESRGPPDVSVPRSTSGYGADPRSRDSHAFDTRGKDSYGSDAKSRDYGARSFQDSGNERHHNASVPSSSRGSYPASASNMPAIGAPTGADPSSSYRDRSRAGVEDQRRWAGGPDHRRSADNDRERKEGYERRDTSDRRDTYSRRDDRGNDRRFDDRHGGGNDERYGTRDKRDDRQGDRRPPWDADRRRDEDKRRPGDDTRRRGGWDDRGDDRRREEDRRRSENARQRRDQDRQQRVEESRRQEEQANRQRNQEERKRAEQRAALEVRKSLQLLSFVQADNFAAVKTGVNKIVDEQSKALGSMRGEILKQVDEAMRRAEERISRALDDRRKFEEGLKAAKQQFAERELKEKEKEEALKRKLEELADLVFVAEAKTDLLAESVENEFHTGDSLRQGELALAVASVEECAAEAEAGHKACLDSAVKNGIDATTLKQITSPETRNMAVQLLKRIGESGSRVQDVMNKSRISANDVIKKIVARKVEQLRKDTFDKYDEDQTGTWTNTGFARYAKEEFGMDAPLELTDEIFENCVHEGDTRLFAESLFLANAALGVSLGNESARKAQEELAAAEKEEAAEREKRAELVEPERIKLKERVKEAALIAETAESEMVEAEKISEFLKATKDFPKFASNEIRERCDNIAAKITSAIQKLEAVKEEAIAIEAKDEFPELAEMKTELAIKLRGGCNYLRARLNKLSALVASSRTLAQKLNAAEVPKTRAAIVDAIRSYMKKESLTYQALFVKTGGSESDGISEEQWISLLELCDLKDLTPDHLSQFFKKRAEEESGKMQLEVFSQLLAVEYKVVSKILLTDALSIADGKVLRKLNVGEVLEVVESPTSEENTSVKRVKVKAKTDGIEGWTSIASNLGTLYLEEGGGCVFKASGSVALRKSRDSTDVLRNLEDGETVELLQYSTQQGESSEKSPSSVMKVCSLVDGTIGWTCISEGEKVCLEPA